jgi:hypothetical protein
MMGAGAPTNCCPGTTVARIGVPTAPIKARESGLRDSAEPAGVAAARKLNRS